MKNETLLEIIKAIAYGMDDEEIANMAECTLDEIVSIKIDYEQEIQSTRKENEVFA